MKSKTTIQIEYQKVTAQARKLEDCADDLKTIRTKLEGIMEELRSGWEGESAQLYFQKCQELSDKLASSQKDLTKTAGVIDKTAEAYRLAELAALQLVQD